MIFSCCFRFVALWFRSLLAHCCGFHALFFAAPLLDPFVMPFDLWMSWEQNNQWFYLLELRSPMASGGVLAWLFRHSVRYSHAIGYCFRAIFVDGVILRWEIKTETLLIFHAKWPTLINYISVIYGPIWMKFSQNIRHNLNFNIYFWVIFPITRWKAVTVWLKWIFWRFFIIDITKHIEGIASWYLQQSCRFWRDE